MNFSVLGGGAGGCGVALELANAGHKVTIIEKREKLLSGSSDHTPCRLGLGFHYSDINTAKKYLHATISFLKKYPNFIVASDQNVSHPHRRGQYFIVKDSLFPPNKILDVYAELKEEYKRLVKEDPANKVLGDPNDFYRPMTVKEFQDGVNTNYVLAGIETAEQVLDWPEFKKHFIKEIENHPNITIIKDTEVTDASHNDLSDGFRLTLKNKNEETQLLDTNFIINCTWENVEAINHRLGFFTPPDARTNRLKVIIEIKLPEDFEKLGPVNSKFFCFGPHCSFTNVGNGTGFISYEPVTNIEASTSLTLPLLSQRLLDGKANDEEKLEYGEKILAGVVQYIPKLKDAEVLTTSFGIVKTKGKGIIDIYAANDSFHRRDYSGVEEQQIGLISNSCMKLLYFLDNASETKSLVDEHIKIDTAINGIVSKVKSTGGNDKVLQHELKKHIKNNLTFNAVKNSKKPPLETFEKTIKLKTEIHRKLPPMKT